MLHKKSIHCNYNLNDTARKCPRVFNFVLQLRRRRMRRERRRKRRMGRGRGRKKKNKNWRAGD